MEQEQQQQALFNRVTKKLDEEVNEDFIQSTKTEKGNTQISERVVIEKIKEVLTLLELTFEEAGSQQSKDFRNVGGIGLNIEIKKTDSPVIYFNDTCPTKDIYYVVFFTGKVYKRSPEKNIPPTLLYINGEEFVKDSPWIIDYIIELTLLKDKYARGENKKNLAGIMEVYPRPTFKANISKFLAMNVMTKAEKTELETMTTHDSILPEHMVEESVATVPDTEVLEILQEEEDESRYVGCEECGIQIDCYNDNINIVYKGDSGNPTEELVLCTMCFEDMKDELIQQDYKCDDWDIDEEEEEEEEEKEEETDEFKCPTCNLVQTNNWCFSCDTNNSCQYCVGIGGNDATEGHREWVCQKCFDKQPEINYEYEYSEEGEENEEEPEEETFEEYQKEKESGVEEEEEEASLSDDVQQSKHSKTDLVKLCVNMDCEQYPSDWDSEEDTEDTYQEGQWKKCCLCDGYFDDDGMGDILYVQEEPNNKEAECGLCGKTKDIVQMKGTGEYLCGNACDESEEEDED